MAQASRANVKANVDLFGGDADAKKKQVEDLGYTLEKLAEDYNTVAKAKRAADAAQNNANDKSIREEAKQIEEATKAYIKNLEAESKVRQLEAAGKQGTVEYAKALKESGEALADYTKKVAGLSDEQVKQIENTNEVALAKQDLAKIEKQIAADTSEKTTRESEAKVLTELKQHYVDLRDAITNYNTAKKAGDTDRMAVEQARIDGIMGEVAAIKEAVASTDMEAATKQKVLNAIQQCESAEYKHAAAVKQVAGVAGEAAKTSNEWSNTVNSLLTRYLSLMAVIRTISSLIQNTVDYVSEYSNKMNEIQIITNKSNAEIDQLASTYRELAKDMSVSSLDMADAAIYFTRQGLAAEEVETRLKNTTMYAKTANIEFETAAELITSVVNSMGLAEQEAEDGRNAAQRVADVFLKVGDNAATSGEEIGTAMQKAGAAAGAFNMEFEWLASYIATANPKNFVPMNANWGIISSSGEKLEKANIALDEIKKYIKGE